MPRTPDTPAGRRLSRSDFEEVMRRAAELAATDPEDADGDLSEAEVYRIASEVGLPDHHVRQAMGEVGGSAVLARGTVGAVLGPEWIEVSRVVPQDADVLISKLDDFLVASRLLQRVRKTREVLVYRPAEDWASQLARAASSTARKYYIAAARLVEVHLTPVTDDTTLVRLKVDPGTRADYVAGAVIGGGAAGVGVGVGVGALVSLAVVAPVALVVGAGVIAGVATASGVTWAVGRSHRHRLDEVRVEMEGILDRLENEEDLEPPSPSWRRWVRRHFHGVAREARFFKED